MACEKPSWLRVILLIQLVASLPVLVRAQQSGLPAQRLSLEQAVHMALTNNPIIDAAQSGQSLAASRLAEARAARLPSVQFSESFTHSNNPVFVFGSLLEQGRFGPQNFAIDALNQPGSISNFRSSLNLRVPVFNRFQVASKIRQAHLSTEQADLQRTMMEQQLRYQVVQAYYGVLIARARKQVADEAVASAEADVKRIRDFYEQGTVVASELLSMEVQLADLKQQQIQAVGDMAAAQASLNTVLGDSSGVDREPTGQLEDRRFEIPSLDHLVQTALKERPDYREAELDTSIREQDIRAARGQYLPDLNLFANFGQSTRDLSGGSSDFAVGASLTFNIFDFGRTPRIDQAVAGRQAADAQKRRKADEVRLEVIKAYHYHQAAEERLDVVSGAVEQAAEAYRIAQDRHGVGLTTLTEVLRAQTASVRARMNVLGARYDYYLGFAQTLLVTGQLRDLSAFVN